MDPCGVQSIADTTLTQGEKPMARNPHHVFFLLKLTFYMETIKKGQESVLSYNETITKGPETYIVIVW